MKYTKELAATLVEQGKISPATARTWEQRGEIPDRWKNPGYTLPAPAPPAVTARLVEILSRPELVLSRFESVPRHKLNDVVGAHRKGETGRNFTVEEVAALSGELNSLHSLLMSFVSNPIREKLIAVVGCPKIRHHALFPNRAAMFARLSRGGKLYVEEIEACLALARGLAERIAFTENQQA